MCFFVPRGYLEEQRLRAAVVLNRRVRRAVHFHSELCQSNFLQG